MSRFVEGDVIDIWWHPSTGHAYYRMCTVIKVLDEVNAMVLFDNKGTPCKCYIDKALPHREYKIMGDYTCSNTK